jgi:hypothetical protein
MCSLVTNEAGLEAGVGAWNEAGPYLGRDLGGL